VEAAAKLSDYCQLPRIDDMFGAGDGFWKHDHPRHDRFGNDWTRMTSLNSGEGLVPEGERTKPMGEQVPAASRSSLIAKPVDDGSLGFRQLNDAGMKPDIQCELADVVGRGGQARGGAKTGLAA